MEQPVDVQQQPVPRRGFLLIHGGMHGSWCWEPLIPLLELDSVAIDMPGRSGVGCADRLALSDYSAAIVAGADVAGFDEVVLVGHSLAGLSMPLAAAALGRRAVHVVFLSALVAGQVKFMTQLLPPPLRQYISWHLRRLDRRDEGSLRLPRAVAQWYFCHDMTSSQTRCVLDNLCAEPVGPMIGPIPPIQLPSIPRTYIGFHGDRVLPGFLQRRLAAKVGAAYMNAPGGHDGLFNHPAPLAALLNPLATGAPVT